MREADAPALFLPPGSVPLPTVPSARQPRVSGIFVQGHDVTEQKRAEAEALAATRELEERIRLRTAELEQANQQLEVAIDEAIAQYQWHRRLAGDARKRNAFLQFIYKGG